MEKLKEKTNNQTSKMRKICDIFHQRILKVLDLDKKGKMKNKQDKNMKKYLQKYLRLKNIETIKLLSIKDLPKNYKAQFEFLNDKRLGDITIAIIPDNLRIKGEQPSESCAQKKLISFKQSYFDEKENTDKIAWLVHELAHCQKFLNVKTLQEYEENMKKPAFEDLKSEYPYPNNLVEEFTFKKQFEYLKSQGKNKEDIIGMIKKYYKENDLPFFNKLLNNIY